VTSTAAKCDDKFSVQQILLCRFGVKVEDHLGSRVVKGGPVLMQRAVGRPSEISIRQLASLEGHCRTWQTLRAKGQMPVTECELLFSTPSRCPDT